MNTNLILIIAVALLGLISIAEGVLIVMLINSRKDYAKKIRRKYIDRNVDRTVKTLKEKIRDLSEEVERLEQQLDFHKGEVRRYKDKMEDYAYAMNKVTSLYEKACTTISEYVQSGLLIREFSDSRIAYDDFQNTWKDLQFRKYIRTYKLGDIVNEPEELKFLFGTSDMGFLSEIFSKIEA